MVKQSKIIQFKEVNKIFPSKAKAKSISALKDVSLEVKKGEIFGVIGYSGAGKRTLIKMINGLGYPTTGKVIIDGQVTSNLSKNRLAKLRHEIGMIFQNYNLLITATVYENVALPLKLQNFPQKVTDKRIEKYLKIVNLWDRRNSYPAQLSGGQCQRVAIARALSQEPKILLSDEATSALDPKTTASILELLKSINQKLGLTIFLITHQLEVAKDICDRIAILNQGKLVETGSTLDIFTKPRKKITQKFLNTNNSLKIPQEILKKEIQKNNILLRLNFTSPNAEKPIVAQLSHKFQIFPNILSGSIGYLQGKPYGELLISIPENKNPKVLKKYFQFLNHSGVWVSEVENK